MLDLGLGVLMEADSAATFATADGIAVGTVDYMSPEQACGREVDGRSDLYGLGCSMYHLMTAQLPFPGNSPIERLGKRISGRHVPITEYLPDLPASFVKVLDRLLAHKPHERYPTAGDAADALQSLLKPRTRPAPVAQVAGPPAAAPAGAPAAPAVTPAAAPAVSPANSAPIAPLADFKPAPVPRPQSAPADGPMVVKVRPQYPRWFEPVARLAECRPQAALAGAIAAATAVFAAGLVLGLLLKASSSPPGGGMSGSKFPPSQSQ